MSGVRVLVGTRKGAFVLTSDGKRKDWKVTGPLFGLTKAPTCSCACPAMPSMGAMRRVKSRLILAVSTAASAVLI